MNVICVLMFDIFKIKFVSQVSQLFMCFVHQDVFSHFPGSRFSPGCVHVSFSAGGVLGGFRLLTSVLSLKNDSSGVYVILQSLHQFAQVRWIFRCVSQILRIDYFSPMFSQYFAGITGNSRKLPEVLVTKYVKFNY